MIPPVNSGGITFCFWAVEMQFEAFAPMAVSIAQRETERKVILTEREDTATIIHVVLKM